MRILYPFLFIILAYPEGVKGQKSISIFEYLYTQDSLHITLTYPFDSLYRTKSDDIDATITIETSNGYFLQDEPLKLNLRGKFRRMKCQMPPLLLNFRKPMLETLGLKKTDEIKLVTHCLDSEEGQENLMEELMCYQLYETLTPFAYRTIWLEVTYEDIADPLKKIISTGFFIEPDKDIMDREGVVEEKRFNIAEDSLYYETYRHAVAFNFLIGNKDWSIVMSRNTKLFYTAEFKKYVIIPYDFDYSNIVGATYRRDVKTVETTHAYDRIYQGEYFNPEAESIITSFLSTEDTMLERLLSAPSPMDDKKRKKIAKYFESWYAYLRKADPKLITYGMVVPYKSGL